MRQTGDTIVEVLIAIGIISLVLTAAYVTANRSYKTMLDAQERGNALKLLERQAEAMRAYKQNGGAIPSGPFCLTVDASGQPQAQTNSATPMYPAVPTNLGIPTNKCILASDATQITDPNQEPAYDVSIIKTTQNIGVGGADYMMTATWDSFVDSGRDSTQLEYGVY